MKHLFTVLCWTILLVALFLACSKKPKPSAPAVEVFTQEVGAAEALPLEDIDIPRTVLVYFGLDQADLRDESALAGVADLLRAQADLRAHIVGHACPLGSEPYNERLALRRACAVAAWMEANGVPSARLKAESLGERRPVAEDPALYHLNRRAAIHFERSLL